MAQKSSNALLVIIAVVVIAILGLLVYKNFIEKTPEEKVADSISETLDDIGNAVQGEANN